MVFSTSSPKETGKIAALLAEEIKRTGKIFGHALVIGLVGNLGAGKTTFVRSFARGLGIKKRITSPTFLILRRHPLKSAHHKNLYHVDAYRIKGLKELLPLKFKDIIADPKNIVIVEWADKIKEALPKKVIRIKFEHGEKENERKVSFQIKKS